METGFLSHAELVAKHGTTCRVANSIALIWRNTTITSGDIYNGDLVEFGGFEQYVYTTRGFSQVR